MATPYTITLEDGKITSLLIKGKPAKGMYMRGLRKAQTAPYWELIDTPCMAQNPFSGVRVELNPLEASIYNFCRKWYTRYERGDFSIPVQTYDDMKYLLLEINTQAYYDLID
jgi:hypothetical protein